MKWQDFEVPVLFAASAVCGIIIGLTIKHFLGIN